VDRARLKTFILLLLLTVNLVFLSLITMDRIQTVRQAQETREELNQVLSDLGIRMEIRNLPAAEGQALYLISRDIEAERQAVNILLEVPEKRDEGGGIHSYISGGGRAQFCENFFQFHFTGQHTASEASIQATAEEILDSLGLTTGFPVHSRSEIAEMLTYIPTIDGLNIANGQISFLFSQGILQEIKGPALWGQTQRYAAGEQLDATTALIRLADHLQEGGVASRFLAAEMGYYLLEGPGYLEFRPVWIIETDSGAYSIDRQNGEVRKI